jgi:hypothetical protein
MQMTPSRKFFSILILIGSSQTGGWTQTPAGVCGSQPFCSETNDFVATVTSFRISTNNVYQQKIIDATVRFQNQTDRPLILGYVDHSGVAMDDQGNRSVPWGPNAYRGIGLVTGNAFEPKLVLRPGGWGEAQFELVQQGTPKVIGSTYALDLTVDEINSTGNQHTLGGEFPLHFQGLSNGSAGGALTSAIAGGPCGVAGAQGAAGKASSATSTAANTLSNIGSIFGKKKTAQNAGQVANAAAGCDPRVNSVATVAGTVAGAAAASNAQQTAPASNMQAQQVAQSMPPVSSNAALQPVATAPQTNTQPAGTTSNTPANLAADANSKTKQAQSRGQQQQQKPQQSAPTSAQASPQKVTSGESAAGTSNGQTAGAAEPWTPPADNAAKAADLVDPLKLPEVAKMPDVVGVRLGMSEQQALQILHGQYPRGRFQEIPAGGIFPTNPKADYGFNILPTDVIATDVVVSLTAPPSQQVAWRVVRYTRRIHTNHANVLAALREKYGKESLAGVANGTITTDDRSIGTLLWVFDEHGNRASLPSPQAFGSSNLLVIPCSGPFSDVGPRIPMEENKNQDWCSSLVGILVTIDPMEIVENTVTNMVDMRLAARTANAYLAWKHDADAKARAAELEKSKKNKPVF